MPQENKKSKKTKIADPCPVCGEELYLTDEYTQRVGLLDNFDAVVGWLCPHCKTEFDTEDHISKFLGKNAIRGEA
jgi:phage terminase large subunit GpA-like protein